MRKLVRSVENRTPVPLNVSDFSVPFYLSPNQKAELFISEIAESKPDAVVVSENPESNWFEVGELPPIGTVCEASHSMLNGGAWTKVEVLKLSDSMAACHIFDGVMSGTKQDLRWLGKFRPIRTERENFIDAAEAEFKKFGIDELVDFGFLYDAGFRLPETKA